jgi:hypothetical protein
MPSSRTQTLPPPEPADGGDELGAGVGVGAAEDVECDEVGAGDDDPLGGEDLFADGDGCGVGLGRLVVPGPRVAVGVTAATTPVLPARGAGPDDLDPARDEPPPGWPAAGDCWYPGPLDGPALGGMRTEGMP